MISNYQKVLLTSIDKLVKSSSKEADLKKVQSSQYEIHNLVSYFVREELRNDNIN